MKIGILNMQYSRHNYGALLQAAALERVVRDLLPGAQVEHIDARPASFKEPAASTRLIILAKRYLGGILGRSPKMPLAGNYEVFSDFRNQNLQLSEKTYFEYADFETENWDYDCVIVGSDQVFRVKFLKQRVPIFFLRFLPESCRRIAYAASFGVDYWEAANDPKLTTEVGQDLEKFDALSVRESSGVDICEKTFGLRATHVLDPTLLIGREYFDSIIDRDAPDVDGSDWSLHCLSEDARYIRLVPGLAKGMGKDLRDIFFTKRQRWPIPARTHFSSVPEWLAKIRRTRDLVLTDSFHCVCISILFEKDFLVFVSEQKGPGRMLSLLGALGLEDRICDSRDSLERAASGARPIVYADVRDRLSEQRNLSYAYLSDALKRVAEGEKPERNLVT